MNPLSLLKQSILNTIFDFLASEYQLSEKNPQLFFNIPPNQEMGHIALPCFYLSKILKNRPQKIALEIVE